jgi:hypothetical protein
MTATMSDDTTTAIPPIDYGVLAQRAAEAHLEACEEALHAIEYESEADVDDPAIGPFCGCTTCVVREVLHAAWPVLQRAFDEGAT